MSYTAAVITISDKGFRGEREDTSGPALCAIAEEYGLDVTYRAIVPDEAEAKTSSNYRSRCHYAGRQFSAGDVAGLSERSEWNRSHHGI